MTRLAAASAALFRLLGLGSLLALVACASMRFEDCQEETLIGRWKTTWAEEYWTFQPDRKLLCEGNCFYGIGIGKPLEWGYEPEASIWSQPIDHIKLIFTQKAFEKTLGAYRCDISNDGQELLLIPLTGPDLSFQRAGSG